MYYFYSTAAVGQRQHKKTRTSKSLASVLSLDRRCGASLLQQLAFDKSEKRVVAEEAPPQMNLTGSTAGDLPSATGKPSEFGAGIALSYSTWGHLKTAEFKNNSRRVEEGVIMAAADFNCLVFEGNRCAAGRAEQSLFRIRFNERIRLPARRASRTWFKFNAVEQRCGRVTSVVAGSERQSR